MRKTHWDPFSGQLEVERHTFQPAAKGPGIARYVLLTGLGATLFIGGKALGFDLIAFLGVPLFFGGVLLLAFNINDKKPVRHALAFDALGQKLGGSWHLQVPSIRRSLGARRQPTKTDIQALAQDVFSKRQDLTVSAEQIDALAIVKYRTDKGPPAITFTDPQIYAVTSRLKPFLMPSPVSAAPISPEALFWWHHEETPLWMAAQLVEHDIRNPVLVSASNLSGNYTLRMVIAVKAALDFDLSVMLSAEIPALKSRFDARLESVAFNDLYKVQLRSGEQLKLFQLLTPAAQTLLIDLFRAAGAEVRVEANAIYLRCAMPVTFDKQAPSRCVAEMQGHVEAISTKLLRLKTYME